MTNMWKENTNESRKRLLKYIAIKTPCDENSDTVPTSQCVSLILQESFADELKELRT